MRVLLLTEGTYPFRWGGLSTWCDVLIRQLPEIQFHLLAMCERPFSKLQFELPPNLVEFRPVPLWGVRNASEAVGGFGLVEARRRARRTSEASIRKAFLPAYEVFLEQLFGVERNDDELAGALHQMYRFFCAHDFDATFRSQWTWEALGRGATERFPALAARSGYRDVRVGLADVTAALQWMYHWLFALSRPLPAADVAHATMAGRCSLIAVVAKLDQGCGFLLSEHGIYLRESYLSEHGSRASVVGKLVKLCFARRMTELAYSLADAVAPCCDYNRRWEQQIGAKRERINTAYYGIDAEDYRAVDQPPNAAPVVVWAGRIDPLKDVETLLRGAAIVLRTRPDVRFLLFGSAPPGNDLYLERCLALHAQLGLEKAVSFEGFTPDTVAAFSKADVVALSSVSEGFPFATLEAMLCGKPIVATAVGGLPEQVPPDCGRTVRPRDPAALAAAILELLEDGDTREALGRAARDRAASLFTLDRFRVTHRSMYGRALARRPSAGVNGTFLESVAVGAQLITRSEVPPVPIRVAADA